MVQAAFSSSFPLIREESNHVMVMICELSMLARKSFPALKGICRCELGESSIRCQVSIMSCDMYLNESFSLFQARKGRRHVRNDGRFIYLLQDALLYYLWYLIDYAGGGLDAV